MTRPRTARLLLVGLLAAACLAPVRAGAEPGSAPAPVSVTLFLLPHPAVSDQNAERVVRAIEKGLRRNPRLALKDSSKLLADYAGEVPTEMIETARRLLAEGSQALLELDSATAGRKLTQAIEALEQVLPYVHKNELAEAMMALAVSQLVEGDQKAARQTLVTLLTWREGLAYDTVRYPPRYLDEFEAAKREVKRKPRGSIELRTKPDGAQAYIDGRYVGVTPTTAEGLPVGYHYVTYRKEGFHKLLLKAEVSPRKQNTFVGELRRSEKYKLVHDSLRRAEEAVENEVADPGMVDLKAFLFIDQAIFVRLSMNGPHVHVDSYLYDLRSKRRLSVVRKDVEPASINTVGSTVAENLYLNVPYDASLAAPPEERPPEFVRRRPFYKTWWFWTAVGVTMTAIVVPVSVAPSEPPRAHEPYRRVDVQMF